MTNQHTQVTLSDPNAVNSAEPVQQNFYNVLNSFDVAISHINTFGLNVLNILGRRYFKTDILAEARNTTVSMDKPVSYLKQFGEIRQSPRI